MYFWRKFWVVLIACAALAVAGESGGAKENAPEEDFQRYSVVPILGYTEETEFQVGVMALLFLKPDEAAGKVPEIGLTAYGSTKRTLR